MGCGCARDMVTQVLSSLMRCLLARRSLYSPVSNVDKRRGFVPRDSFFGGIGRNLCFEKRFRSWVEIDICKEFKNIWNFAICFHNSGDESNPLLFFVFPNSSRRMIEENIARWHLDTGKHAYINSLVAQRPQELGMDILHGTVHMQLKPNSLVVWVPKINI